MIDPQYQAFMSQATGEQLIFELLITENNIKRYEDINVAIAIEFAEQKLYIIEACVERLESCFVL